MPRIATQFTVDSSSTTGSCVYPLISIGGVPEPTSVVVNGQPFLMVADDYVCTPAPTSSVSIIPPCPPLPRTVKAIVNTSVLIDGKYPVVEGDVVKLLESEDRPLTGPYQHTRIVIGSNIN